MHTKIEALRLAEGGEADLQLTYPQVSRLTGLPVGTLYSLVAQNRIPYTRLGPRLVRFPRRELMRWLEERTVLPNEVA